MTNAQVATYFANQPPEKPARSRRGCSGLEAEDQRNLAFIAEGLTAGKEGIGIPLQNFFLRAGTVMPGHFEAEVVIFSPGDWVTQDPVAPITPITRRTRNADCCWPSPLGYWPSR
jgi:hypothetical protein